MDDHDRVIDALVRMQDQLARIEREQAKAETHIEHIRSAADSNAAKLEAISEKLPVIQVNVAKLNARQGAMSAALGSILGGISGFFGAKF